MYVDMLQNNEAIKDIGPLLPLINNPNIRGIKAMTNTSIPYPLKNSKTPEYRTWCAMKARCNNPNVNNYHNYGERGISVCERWNIFENFFDDMGPRPTDYHTIERIKHDKGYGPGNCKWATRKEQSDNRRDNINIAKDGETHNQTDWSRLFGLSDKAISRRIQRGMTPEEAIATPGHIYKARAFNAYDKTTGELVGQWRMKTDCARDLGISSRHIGSVLNGNRNHTGNYTMKYI